MKKEFLVGSMILFLLFAPLTKAAFAAEQAEREAAEAAKAAAKAAAHEKLAALGLSADEIAAL
jgi:hypothetical protein